MRDVKILFVFGSIWEKEDEIGDQRIHLLYIEREIDREGRSVCKKAASLSQPGQNGR